MNNQVQFVYLWCCIPPDLLVQINNLLSLVLFSAVIRKRKGKKLIRKTIKHKDTINKDRTKQRYNLSFFILKTFNFFIFLKNYRFCRKSGNGGGPLTHLTPLMSSTQCVQKSICDSHLN